MQAEHQRQLSVVFQQHTAQVAHLQTTTQLEEALKWRQHLAALEGQLLASRARADRLEEENRAARNLVPWTPAAHEVVLLWVWTLDLAPLDQSHSICIVSHGGSTLTTLNTKKQSYHCCPGPECAG